MYPTTNATMSNIMKKHTLHLTALVALTALFSSSVYAGEKMDQKELDRKAKYFLKWDADGDKQLNKDEYTEMTRVQFEKKDKPGYEEEAAKRFKRKDADGDGFVTFEEQNGVKLPE